mmetsp:Transcript_33810/g.86675  ORF Transcript_33810/g.86675 Transcript_33810/m.86675 type:complete len:240 (-) Transcript_33810:2683-3402(-)
MSLDHNLAFRVLGPHALNIGTNRSDVSDAAIDRDQVRLVDINQDSRNLRLVLLIWRRRRRRLKADRLFLGKSRGHDEEDQQDEDHVQHGREVNIRLFRCSVCTSSHQLISIASSTCWTERLTRRSIPDVNRMPESEATIPAIVGIVARDTPADMAFASAPLVIAMMSNTATIPVTVPSRPSSGASATIALVSWTFCSAFMRTSDTSLSFTQCASVDFRSERERHSAIASAATCLCANLK